MATRKQRDALARRSATKKANEQRIAEGRRPVLGGKQVSVSTWRRRTGSTVGRARANANRRARRGG